MVLPIFNKEKPSAGTQAAIGLGYQMLSAMAVFVGGGYYLDSRRGGGHLYTLIGVALAFVYSGYEVWKLLRLMNEEDAKTAPPRQDGPETKP